MAQSGFTPIQLFRTTTAAAVPTAGSLADGELAINLTDEKLYFKNASGTVKLLASSGGASGTVTSVDVSGGTTGLTFSGGPITSSGTITMAGTLGVANGGTGASSLTSGYLLKGNGTSAVSASVVYDDGTNVGIGTASPSQKLTVAVADGVQAAQLRGATGYLRIRPYVDATNGAYIDATNTAENAYLPLSMAGSSIRLTTNGGLAATIDSSGNLSLTKLAFNIDSPFYTGGNITAGSNALGVGTTGAAQVGFFTNNSERVRITSAGNVGIGVTNPDSILHVRSGAVAGMRIGFGGASENYYDADTQIFRNIAGAERMHIDSTGRIGVGTTPINDASLLMQMNAAAGSSRFFAVNKAGNYGIVMGYNNVSDFGQLGVIANAPLLFLTNNSERMRITSAGSVGIGTTNPGYKLAVAGTGGTAVLNLLETGVRSWGVRAGGSVSNSFDIADFTAGATRMVIDSSGNMGVGTSSPEARLHVFLSSGVVARFGEASTGAVTNIHNRLAALPTTGTGTNIGWLDSGSGFAAGSLLLGARPAVGLVVLSSSGAADMVVNTSGNVGIGTTSPGAKLHVAGGGNIRLTAASDGSNGVFQVYDSASSTLFQLYNDSTKANLAVVEAKPMVFYTTNTERMRITSGGNMTVGSTGSFARLASVAADGTYQLALVGTSKAVRMRSDTTNFKIEAVDQTLSSSYEPLWLGGSLIQFGTSTTERMRLDASGNLGIGTTSPQNKLVVSNGGAGGLEFLTNGVIQSYNRSGAAYQPIYLDAQSILFRPSGSEAARIDASGNVLINRSSTSGLGKLNVDGGADFTGGNVLLCRDTGNVGIGTASPSTILHVAGSSVTEVRVTSSGNLTTGAASLLRFGGSNSATSGYIGYGGTASTIDLWNTLAGSLTFGTSNLERMRITSGGLVGIAVSPTTHRLEVNGNVYTFIGQSYYCYTADYGLGTPDSNGLQLFTGSGDTLRFGHRASGTFTERMRIDASGNLLVGTTSATAGYLMSVNGALTLANGYSLSWGAYNSGGPTIAGSTNFLAFYPNGASSGEKMRITSAGNVGIGTTSPVSKLEASLTSSGYWTGSAYTGDPTAITVTNTNPGGYDPVFMGRMTDSGGTSKRAFALGTVGTSAWTAGSVGTQTCDFYVLVRNNADALVERMRITSAGNVGIGTSSPGAKLTLVGASELARLANATPYLSFYNAAQSTRFGYIQHTGTALALVNEQAGQMEFYTNSTERMRITSGGNLLLGTTASSGAPYIVELNTTSDTRIGLKAGNVLTGIIQATTNNFAFGTSGASTVMTFSTNGAERFRILAGGGITSSDLADAVGYKGLPQNSRTTGYTLALSDMGKHISITTGNITIPANGSVAFPVGSAVTIYNNSGSTQTISITTDTLRQAGTTNTGTRTLAAYGVATVLKVASTTWVISGNVS